MVRQAEGNYLRRPNENRPAPVAKSLVCVVIPVHRNPLTQAERAALERCLSVLHRYPIAIVAPEGLDTGALLRRYPQLRQETFADEYFVSAYSYNKLMLSDEFYARFAAYEYILVHQLDAFVFSDQLHDWCMGGYDYIGAPWIWSSRPPTLPYRLYMGALRKLCRLIGRPNPADLPPDKFFQRQLCYAAGNGGLSLRRVARMREVLARFHERAEVYRTGKPAAWAERPSGRLGEDVFFCVEANRYRRHVKTPGFEVAARFAWEMNPAIAARISGGALPFGCHGWDKLNLDQWRPVFARLGYHLDDLLEGAESGPSGGPHDLVKS